jgi:hypothetical protein
VLPDKTLFPFSRALIRNPTSGLSTSEINNDDTPNFHILI